MIDFKFVITSVDSAAGVMEVTYSADGIDEVVVSAPIPRVGESIESIVSAYAPSQILGRDVAPLIDVQVGFSGEIKPSAPVSENSQMWQQVEIEQAVAKALVKFGLLASNPTTIPVEAL